MVLLIYVSKKLSNNLLVVKYIVSILRTKFGTLYVRLTRLSRRDVFLLNNSWKRQILSFGVGSSGVVVRRYGQVSIIGWF